MAALKQVKRPIVYSLATSELIERLSRSFPQGIVLSGPAGIGLLSLAQVLAGRVTKTVITIAPDAKGTISIETIRELYTLGRSKGGVSVFIIDDADTMGREAQNALLKLLEEPVDAVKFILTSHYPERLLPTIRSRVAEYSVARITTEQSHQLLDSLKVTDATQRAQLLFIADGLPASLTRYVMSKRLFEERALIVRDARQFLQGTKEERLLIGARYKDRTEALKLVRDMQVLLRRNIEATPSQTGTGSLEKIMDTETALSENASVRLSLTSLSLTI